MVTEILSLQDALAAPAGSQFLQSGKAYAKLHFCPKVMLRQPQKKSGSRKFAESFQISLYLRGVIIMRQRCAVPAHDVISRVIGGKREYIHLACGIGDSNHKHAHLLVSGKFGLQILLQFFQSFVHAKLLERWIKKNR